MTPGKSWPCFFERGRGSPSQNVTRARFHGLLQFHRNASFALSRAYCDDRRHRLLMIMGSLIRSRAFIPSVLFRRLCAYFGHTAGLVAFFVEFLKKVRLPSVCLVVFVFALSELILYLHLSICPEDNNIGTKPGSEPDARLGSS